MDFLQNFLGEDVGIWGLVISGVFGILTLIFGSKFQKAKKDFAELGKEFAELLETVTNIPNKPSQAYINRIKKETEDVKREWNDIVEIFKKDK